MKLPSKISSVLLGLVAGGLLAGCGSGGPDPATVTVNADTSAVAWNAASTIDVLGNDSASRGSLTLTSVAGALHGTAVVANGKVSYTPAPGYYGAETLSYTATATEGGASAKGELRVAVEAVLTLNGNASDRPLSNATVTAAVGAKNFTTTTNAAGDFSVVVRSTAPLEFVTLTAVGSGAQSTVKLVSLVGDIDALVKGADAQGQVGRTAVPALAVSHYTTAFMALATKALNGTVPGNAQQLRDVAVQVAVGDIMYQATAIRLVADRGVPLPAGISDTLALVNSATGVAAVYVAANSNDSMLGYATRAGVELDVDAGSAFTLGGLSERTVVYGTAAMTVTYRADGSGKLSGRMGERSMKWVADGATVRLTYDTPVEWLYEPDTMPFNSGNNAYTVRERSEGMVIRLVLNDMAMKWGETGTVTWVNGPNAGKPVPTAATGLTTTNAPSFLLSVLYADRRLAIDAAMTATGATLIGAISTPDPKIDTTDLPGQGYLERTPTETDVLEFISATQARYAISEEVVSWKVQDNWISITHANGKVWRFALLAKDDLTGKQTWLAAFDAMTIKKSFVGFTPASPKLQFTQALALRNWRSGSRSMIGQLNADGTVTTAECSASFCTNTWEITPAGDLVIKQAITSTGEMWRLTRYVPIKLVGERLWVFAYDLRPMSPSTFVGYFEDHTAPDA